MDKKITVLFTACCGMPTCGTIEALKKSDKYEYYIIGADCSPNNAVLNYVDKLYKVPRCKEDNYIEELIKICKECKVDVVVPLISDEIEIIHNSRRMFDELGIKLLLSSEKSKLLIANNKFLLEEYLLANGIDIMPKTIKINKQNAIEALVELGYPKKPVCLKVINGCGAAGFKIIDDAMAKESVFSTSRKFRGSPYISFQTFVDALDNMSEDFMLQEYLSGVELGTLCLVDNGETIYSPSHNNISMDNAITVYCELVDDKEANNIVRKINKLLKLDGNIGYDFKRDDKGNLKLLEINPRISATVSLASKAGLNLIELGVHHALGLEIDKNIIPQYGMKLMRNYGTLYELNGVPIGK